MGLFGKLKAMKNAVTGGAAKVTVEVDAAGIGEPAAVRVKALAKADVKLSGVYIDVKSVEKAEVRNVEVEHDDDEAARRKTVRGTHETGRLHVDISGAEDLAEGQEYSWDGEFQFPPSSRPSFDGKTIQHVWYVRAGLDARGNDPDSGWVEFAVR